MKTVVMGAGAMGGLYGALLTLSGGEVWLVDTWKDHVEVLASKGLVIEDFGEVRRVPVNAATEAAAVGKADLILVFVKTYHTAQAVSDSRLLQKEDTVFLSLQNGLGNEDVICRQIDRGKVMLGVTNHGATLIGPGRIRHAGRGKTFIGELDGKVTERAIRIARMFSDAGIETEVSAAIQDLIWNKLFVNVGINALTALTGFRNGQILEHPETLRLMEALVSEAVEVAGRKGVRIDGDPIEHAKAVAEATALNRSSMGQDFDSRRRTEIDTINGAIVKEAERLGIPVPCNQMITDLVKAIERQFQISNPKHEVRNENT